jgi:hypothetical protein
VSELPEDPSGITVHDGIVYIVGNKSNRKYFRFDAKGLPKVNGIVKLDTLDSEEVISVSHKRATDLESIDVIEGELVVLSEDSRRIIHHDRTLVDYSNLPSLKESKREGCGLEGMAIRELPDHSSQIAVIWEGGIFRDEQLQPPLLLTHRVAQSFHGTKTVLHASVWEDRLVPIKIDDALPHTQFRCPDIAWCWSTSTDEWALILLLSHRHEDHEKYLQVYNLSGKPISPPVRLDASGMPEERLDQNWEGLCWHTDENGDHLLLVNDTNKRSKMLVCRVSAPNECRRQPPSHETNSLD